jgi:hypothetical protein
MKKKRKTASEIMRELSQDKAYQRKMTERECRLNELHELEDEATNTILNELHKRGFKGKSYESFVKLNAPLSGVAVEIILNALSTTSQPRTLEMLIRSLGYAGQTFDGKPLAVLFDNTNDDTIKWVIVNTIAIINPLNIDDWVTKLTKHPYWGKVFKELKQ